MTALRSPARDRAARRRRWPWRTALIAARRAGGRPGARPSSSRAHGAGSAAARRPETPSVSASARAAAGGRASSAGSWPTQGEFYRRLTAAVRAHRQRRSRGWTLASAELRLRRVPCRRPGPRQGRDLGLDPRQRARPEARPRLAVRGRAAAGRGGRRAGERARRRSSASRPAAMTGVTAPWRRPASPPWRCVGAVAALAQGRATSRCAVARAGAPHAHAPGEACGAGLRARAPCRHRRAVTAARGAHGRRRSRGGRAALLGRDHRAGVRAVAGRVRRRRRRGLRHGAGHGAHHRRARGALRLSPRAGALRLAARGRDRARRWRGRALEVLAAAVVLAFGGPCSLGLWTSGATGLRRQRPAALATARRPHHDSAAVLAVALAAWRRGPASRRETHAARQNGREP